MAEVPFAADQNEAQRLRAVHALHLLDTPSEPEFEEATHLAAMICGTPMSAISILDEHRQWFKARIGIVASETPRNQAFCNYAIGRNDPLIVPDATDDIRFHLNPLVLGEPNIRFYAGMPLNTSSGSTIGSLCVMDSVPRQLSSEQQLALAILGRQVSIQIELRTKNWLLREALAEKERVRAELRNSNLLFRAFMDHSPMVGYMKDAGGRMVYYNRPFEERFEVTSEEWIGKDDNQLWPSEFAAAFRQVDLGVLKEQKAIVTEESSPSPDGSIVYWRTYKFPVTNAEGAQMIAGLSLDVSREKEVMLQLEASHAELHQVNQRLLELSLTDDLTRLRNRRAFDERLDQECIASNATAFPLSLLMIDVDHFKSINDNFGHATGDDILGAVARILVRTSRTVDVVARHGGEEFAILLPNTPQSAAAILAERVRRAVESFAWRRGSVTISIGVASWSAECNTPACLLKAADAALYLAKNHGRNRIEVAAQPAELPHSLV